MRSVATKYDQVAMACSLLTACNLGSAVVTPFLPLKADELGIGRQGVATIMGVYSLCQIAAFVGQGGVGCLATTG